MILPEALEATTAEAVVSLAVTVQLPSSPIRELRSPSSPAAPTLTGWGRDNGEADERTVLAPSDLVELAGDCNSEDDDGEGSWTQVGKVRVRPVSPEPSSPSSSSTCSSDLFSDQGELHEWGLGASSSHACSPTASTSYPADTPLVASPPSHTL